MSPRYTLAVLVTVLAVAAPAAHAQTKAAPAAQPSAVRNPPLDQLECRTLLKLDGDERAYTILYYHGFISGRQNLLLLPAEQLAEATDRIIDRCIDKPGEKVLTVFEQVRAGK